MCPNGQYNERDIRLFYGFISERWRIEPGVLLKPATVFTKAWEHRVPVSGPAPSGSQDP